LVCSLVLFGIVLRVYRAESRCIAKSGKSESDEAERGRRAGRAVEGV